MRILIRGLKAIIVSALIWWLGRSRGDEELEEIEYNCEDEKVYKALFVSSHRLPPKKNKAEFKEWWESLSDEERDDAINVVHNPLGNKED